MFFFYLAIFAILISNVVKSKKALHMLQQNHYNENNRYLKWILKNKKQVLTGDILLILLSLVGVFVTYDIENTSIVLLLLITFTYFILSYILYNRQRKEQVKLPLVITSRIKRLIVTITIFYFIPSIFALFVFENKQAIWFCLTILITMSVFNYFIVFLSNLANYPLEKMVYYYYRHLAVTKLNNMNQLKVVGITGSYGKTSSKNILNDILNIKYISRPTPKSFNTNYGLIKTINNDLDKFDDIFIAEMGAYTKGDIKQLCDLVQPKYGILTRIGTAHLETFGSEDLITRTKFELIESLPEDGIGVLNRDDPKQVSYSLKNNCKIIWIGIEHEDVDVYATNIKCSYKGTTFDCIFKGDKKTYSFETRLLGKHNVYNILASLALGRVFNISIKELQQAVKRIKPIEHRLELKKINDFYQIDDAYNSNPVGAQNALEVLNMMKGTKVVVTPGMAELGEKEKKLNKEFGKQISNVADYVILIGEKKTKPILEGLQENQFDKDKIFILNDVVKSYALVSSLKLEEDIYALFENDLTDIYNE